MKKPPNRSAVPIILPVAAILGCILGALAILAEPFFGTLYVRSESTPTSQSSMIVTAPVYSIPEFPWPPPSPSASTALTFNSAQDSNTESPTLGDIERKIKLALQVGGYDEISYYSIPRGFVIVTRIEQIYLNGVPDKANRWVSELQPVSLRNFSISKYLEALIGVPKGYYRVFAFIVTSDIFTQSSTPVGQSTAESWIASGANALPSDIKSMPYTSDYSCTLYVYEFLQSGYGEQAKQVKSNITAKEQLQAAGIWNELEE